MMQTQPKIRIFIHHEGALGDLLLSLPCIRMLKNRGSFLHLAANKEIAGLLLAGGAVDEISSSDSAAYCSLYADAPDEKLPTFLSSFDSACIFTVNASSALAAAIERTIPDIRMVVTIPPDNSALHAGEFRLRQCGFSPEEASWMEMLHIPGEEERRAAELLRGRGFHEGRDILISLHPGSGGKKKCWPWSNHEALIRMIRENPRYFVLLLTGPAEDAEFVQTLSELGKGHERVIHLHYEPLIRIAALLARSDFYIGNDSGISHLAGLLRCRGAVLFGPTDPAVWRPFGDTLDVLRFDASTPAASVTPEFIFKGVLRIASNVEKEAAVEGREWRGGRGSNPRPPT